MLRLFINLDRSPIRLKSIQEQVNNLNIEFKRIPAIDGNDLSTKQIESLTPNILSSEKIWFPFPLIKSEVACFLSHRLCWERLLTSSEKYALVVEDDIQFTKNAITLIESDQWIPEKVDLIQLHSSVYLETFRVKNSHINIESPLSCNLYEIISPTAIGTQAYIISRNAAKAALEKSKRIIAPVDEFLFSIKSPFRKVIKSYKINPGIVHTKMGTVSTICTDKRTRKKNWITRLHPMSLYLKFFVLFLTLTNKTKIQFCIEGEGEQKH